MPATDLPVPPAYTPMTKPRDLAVKGWWPDTEGATVQEGDEDRIPDDAEEGVVEMSDPWFLETERRQRDQQGA